MSAMIEGKNIYLLKANCKGAIGTVSRLTTYLAQRHCYIMELAQFDEIETGNFYVRCVFSTTPGITPKLEELRTEFGQGVAERDGMEWEMHDTLALPKVLIMVSKYDHCLDDLLYRQRTGEIKMEIPAIVSNHPDLKRLADWYEIPFYHLPITPETKQEQERQVLDLIEETGAELVVLARYMQILSSNLCEELAGRAINIHHSFLPGFKGAKPYHQAFERGVKLIGATAHYVTTDLDEGPIIEQVVERVDHTYSPAQLAAVGRDAENMALSRAVRYHLEHRVFPNGNKTVVFR
ncbi:formyltetrahydrofolate deformylase [Halomonas sp. MCCC 1A17488]|uniref:Formyltetrahydrofolate deformylase n=3 Tax=Oceanospirillales TaxID=135619 RepID=A0A6I6SVA2_9GAMM|nr:MULTISPECIES: formyltetrahydrofolate deformylase [Halomonas]MCE8017031.1 formyltetrahydrofolate deformylase [Halomonas sp. MCCC 1A17488]MCE8035006.1 formyltetrahydrofolate deformylase [Halomonas sp. MCCC 1A11057]MCG3240364.1 formyltetrahydrofolate deformylase [Halomonas sp. MCCC 1A17488]QHC51995.1 formyltetrahydrofolate deformylase [Halomonas tianxiuensis]QPP49769.1 formyltetrahydrofolate deformylase [Halomonas sp. SS10-MC5]